MLSRLAHWSGGLAFAVVSIALMLAAGPSVAQMSSGTGFFVTRNGHLITSLHVVDGANEISIKTYDGKLFRATVLASDRNNDLVVLKVDGKFSPLALAQSGAVKRGASVITIGFPNLALQGFEPKVTDGIVSSLSGARDDPTRFQVSVPVQPGNSGGPLLTMDGSVIGVIASKLDAANTLRQTGTLPENVSYAVKASYVRALLDTQALPAGSLPNASRKQGRDFAEVASGAEKSIALVLVDTNRYVERARREEQLRKEEGDQQREREAKAKQEAEQRAAQEQRNREEQRDRERQADLIKYRIQTLEADRNSLVSQYRTIQQNPPRFPNNPFWEGMKQREWQNTLQAVDAQIQTIEAQRAEELQRLESLYRR